MGFLEIVGIIAVLITACVLFKEMGYDGWYFTDFFLSIILQVIMVGGLYLALRKFVPTGKVFFIAAAAASFAAPLLGYIVFHAPHNKEVKRENNIRKAIRRSAKYKEFSDYIDRHNDEIIAVGGASDSGASKTYSQAIPRFFAPCRSALLRGTAQKDWALCIRGFRLLLSRLRSTHG